MLGKVEYKKHDSPKVSKHRSYFFLISFPTERLSMTTLPKCTFSRKCSCHNSSRTQPPSIFLNPSGPICIHPLPGPRVIEFHQFITHSINLSLNLREQCHGRDVTAHAPLKPPGAAGGVHSRPLKQ